MPHPLPALAVAFAAPLVGLAVHVASTHASGALSPARAAALPNNLCASCHGGRKVATANPSGALDAGDLVAARDFLRQVPRG
ncbi:hypothetical protein [Frateuria soli]|uniref:hypothetical protein n=1 Tax=Frateuria soli TaxID=1542730 RepID=UPI001E4A3494|nr:hypothetical protein [Frateuria soli]UGB37619.1 hypothetical protein LQ771_12390 [Frateuria soli]